MGEDKLYSDSLVTIFTDRMVFENYYFPTCSKKIVRLTDIIEIHKCRANLRTGKWRIHGTGDFTTWFPYDGDRPKRNHIYRMFLGSQRVKIGFTVENEADAEAVFTRAGLKLVEKPGT